MERKVKIELEPDAAFGAFAVLSRFAQSGRLEARDECEKNGLIALSEHLDDELVERFRDEYKRFVADTSDEST